MAITLQDVVEVYLKDPSPAHREAAVLASIKLVRSLVGRMFRPDSHLVTREDLESTAILGLLQALDSYRLEHNTTFVTHAYRRIQGALLDYMREIDPLSRGRRQKLAKAQNAIDVLHQIMDNPTDHDVADYMGVSIDEYHSILQDAQSRFALSLDSPCGPDSAIKLSEALPSEAATAEMERVEEANSIEVLLTLIPTLPERERNVLALYYYEGLTLKEIGTVIGLTEARISQILGKTLLKLKAQLNAIRD